MSDKTGTIKKNSRICGHCKYIKSVNGSWRCDNPASYRYRDVVAYTYSPCDAYIGSAQNGQKTPVENGEGRDVPEVEINVIPDPAADQVKHNVTQDVEQISQNVVIGRRESYHEDGKNVISVIITAISVHINMPRGTVKALMACFIALLITIVLIACNGKGGTAENSTETTPDISTQREYSEEEEAGKAVNSERVASEDDYVIISARYRYNLPDGVKGVWEPDDYYEENETFCDFINDGDIYTIRSYLLQFTNDELSDIVKSSISQFEGYKLIDEEYIEGKYGKVLRIRFEATDTDGTFSAVTGYYWSDTDPHICCLEVSSDEWHDGVVEEKVLNSVYRISDDSSQSDMVPQDAEDIWAEQQKEDAMNSIAEDAMRDQYYDSEQKNYPW